MELEIYKIIGEALAAIIIFACTCLTRKLNTWVNQKVDAQDREDLLILIDSLVAAAEQMYKKADKTGEVRKEYVLNQLECLGYNISPELDALVEGAVYELNKNR